MIYTVTLNPALDYVMGLDALTPGVLHRARWEELQPGGKGLNVSILLSRLGVETTALGFLAGDTGELLRRRVESEGVRTDFVSLPAGMTRINVKLLGEREETEVNGVGPAVPPEALESLLDKLGELTGADTLVLSGSVPPTLPRDIYGRMLDRVALRGVRCVVDTSGEALCRSLSRRPFLIKPNCGELSELTGEHLSPEDTPAILTSAKALQARGARNVLVSLGARGALLLTEEGDIFTQPSAVGEAQNSVGAGDSMVAGLLAGLEEGDWMTALRLGAAAGGATAFSRSLATGEEVRALCRTLS